MTFVRTGDVKTAAFETQASKIFGAATYRSFLTANRANHAFNLLVLAESAGKPLAKGAITKGTNRALERLADGVSTGEASAVANALAPVLVWVHALNRLALSKVPTISACHARKHSFLAIAIHWHEAVLGWWAPEASVAVGLSVSIQGLGCCLSVGIQGLGCCLSVGIQGLGCCLSVGIQGLGCYLSVGIQGLRSCLSVSIDRLGCCLCIGIECLGCRLGVRIQSVGCTEVIWSATISMPWLYVERTAVVVSLLDWAAMPPVSFEVGVLLFSQDALSCLGQVVALRPPWLLTLTLAP